MKCPVCVSDLANCLPASPDTTEGAPRCMDSSGHDFGIFAEPEHEGLRMAVHLPSQDILWKLRSLYCFVAAVLRSWNLGRRD